VSPPASFNLVDQPWILAQGHDGDIRTLSLSEIFTQVDEIRQLVGDVPTQVFAINRLLVAILHRALAPTKDDWLRWWRAGELPQDALGDYWDRWRERFDLLHSDRPFYQVADLHTAKGEFTGVDRLIADAPANIPYLTTKVGDAVESLTFAEAARWVVHCQAFDPSGIKSGAVGDERVKGGKGYPIGIGAAGQIGGVLAVGQNQFQTLLLNLVPQSANQQREDWAAWEAEPPHTSAPYYRDDKEAPHQPDGRAELLTWQSRRLRLVHDGQRVRQALVANGDRFSALNLHNTELMTAWRQSEAQARKSGEAVAFMPRRHQPGRALWRGLSSLLESQEGIEQMPGTLAWVGGLLGEEELDQDLVVTARALGMDYINNSAVVGAVIDDEVPVPVRLLDRQRPELRIEVGKAIKDTEEAAYAYGDFVANVRLAAGGESGDRIAVREHVYAELDGPFRRWIGRLADPRVGGVDATAAWAETARPLLLRLARAVIENAGPVALTGRIVSGRNREYHLDAGLAERWFRNKLFTIFPGGTSLEES